MLHHAFTKLDIAFHRNLKIPVKPLLLTSKEGTSLLEERGAAQNPLEDISTFSPQVKIFTKS